MPYLGSTLFVVTLIVALALGMTGFFALARALWPGWSMRSQERWASRPVSTTLVGAAMGLPAFGLIAALGDAGGPLGAVALLLAAGLIGIALVGAGGLAARIGGRLPSAADAQRPWVQTVRGGLVLELSCLLPLLGWFVILPIALLGGIGAAVLGLRRSVRPTSVHRTQPQSQVVSADAAAA